VFFPKNNQKLVLYLDPPKPPLLRGELKGRIKKWGDFKGAIAPRQNYGQLKPKA